MRRLLFAALFALSLAAAPLLSLMPTASAATPGCTYYKATGHNLCGEFAEYWNTFGGLAVYGYPITEATKDPTTGLLTQWFERARFELHPGADPAHFNVELGLLGVNVGAQDPNRAPFQPTAKRDSASCVYFAATKQNLCGGFYAYWKKFGGLAVYGMPISREFQENGVTVQYFERQRFEWHPGAWPARFDVELGRLGAELHAVEPPVASQQPVIPDKNCSDFSTQPQAQQFFDSHGGSPTNNVDDLDADHDGIACEALPNSVYTPPSNPSPPPSSSHPAGATGQCRDGSYTYAAHSQGACSHHGGLAAYWG